jgi:hypothetical protein
MLVLNCCCATNATHRLDDDLMEALDATDASSKALAGSGAVDTVPSAEET